jgi:hypothetical protein
MEGTLGMLVPDSIKATLRARDLTGAEFLDLNDKDWQHLGIDQISIKRLRRVVKRAHQNLPPDSPGARVWCIQTESDILASHRHGQDDGYAETDPMGPAEAVGYRPEYEQEAVEIELEDATEEYGLSGMHPYSGISNGKSPPPRMSQHWPMEPIVGAFTHTHAQSVKLDGESSASEGDVAPYDSQIRWVILFLVLAAFVAWSFYLSLLVSLLTLSLS